MTIKNERAGLVGAIRQEAIGFPDLTNMERHGKREDASGQRRRIRDTAPLVYRSLDLKEARKAHMAGVKQSGRSACLHALVQFPTGLLDGTNEDHQAAMLHQAVAFLNRYHGGDAVFAARLDRDEKGRHTVDAFLMPRYDYHYKDGRTAKKASVSKFSKAEAKRRFGRDDRRSQGSALQDAFFEHLRDQMQLEGVLPPMRKKATTKDRLEPEELGLRKDRRQLQLDVEELSRANRIARARNSESADRNDIEAKRLDGIATELEARDQKLSAVIAAFEKSAQNRAAALDQREAGIRRDAKTLHNIRLSSGLGVSSTLKRMMEQGFESQDVR
ncbi:hypothetical protein LCM28_13385 [Salipiger pacificus]|nr:hypothetical protein [Alloyangia pacifica]